MKKERFKSKMESIYVALAGIAGFIYLGYSPNRYGFNNDTLEIFVLILGLIALVIYSKATTYLEIQDGRMLINSGYRFFGKDVMDIRDIKYVYRHPEFILKWYGSRMVFYIKDENGKLRQSSVREVNYSAKTMTQLLKRLKEIKSTIEFDPEYEQFLKGNLVLTDASNNTVKSVEARLKAKEETWG